MQPASSDDHVRDFRGLRSPNLLRLFARCNTSDYSRSTRVSDSPSVQGAHCLTELAEKLFAIAETMRKHDAQVLETAGELLEKIAQEMVFSESVDLGEVTRWLVINTEDIDDGYNDQLQSFLSS